MRDGNEKVNLELVEDMKLHPGILVRLIFFFFSEAESGALVCAGVEIGVGIVQTTWK